MVNSAADLKSLHCWFWAKKDDWIKEIEDVNKELGLTGDCELKPDLPCISIGSTEGLLILSANPGWDCSSNKTENDYCRESCLQYCSFMEGFFHYYPIVLKRKNRWWSKPMSFMQLLPTGREGFRQNGSSSEKWANAHLSKQIGGWELFPFHSKSDGVTPLALSKHGPQWLKDCMQESLLAAFRLSPKVMLVASKTGCALTRNLLSSSVQWCERQLGSGNKKTSLYYCKNLTFTEIIAIPHQIFSAHRSFTNAEIFDAVQEIRRDYSKRFLLNG